MLSGIKDYLIIGSFFLIILIIAFFKLQLSSVTNENKKLKIENEQIKQSLINQNNAIQALKIEYKKQEKKLSEAQEESDHIREEGKKKVNQIINESVNRDCKKAIHWAIKKSREI